MAAPGSGTTSPTASSDAPASTHARMRATAAGSGMSAGSLRAATASSRNGRMRAAKMSDTAARRMSAFTSSSVSFRPASRAAASASMKTATRSTTPQVSRCSPADQPLIGSLFQFVMKPRFGFTTDGIWPAGTMPVHSIVPRPSSGSRGSVSRGRRGRAPRWK
jgi:hypothetical protein